MRFSRAYFLALVALCALLPAGGVSATSVADQQAALQKQLNEINQEIAQNQAQLAAEQKQRTSYERDVAILGSQINQAQLEIKQRDLVIQQLQEGIAQKETGITSLDTSVAAGQASLAQIIRETNQIDGTPLAARILNGSLDDFFQEIADFQVIQRALGDAFNKMGSEKTDLLARKQALETQQQQQSDLLQLQVAQQNSLKETEKEKQDLVTAARGQEAVYLQIIENKQQTAAQIESALFALRDTSKTVSFGDMYSYAKEASAKTGVRPALILGILREESNLGQNVGTGNWKTDMKAPRDTVPFQQITTALGLNPDTLPVSKKPCYGNPCSGWGGAMGPAQFIPSTWVLYQDRIASATGQNPPNPWDPRTAAFAAAILLMDNGADVQTPAAERLAALRYLAGRANATNPTYAFYGRDVMQFADQYQQDIGVLGG